MRRALTNTSVYHAHETTAVDPFAVALLCGDVRADVSAHPVISWRFSLSLISNTGWA